MRPAAFALPLLLLAGPLSASTVTVGTATASAGGTAAVPITFAAGGVAVSSFAVDLTFAAPLSYSSVSLSASAVTAGKTATTATITGGVRLLMIGINQTLMPDGVVATMTFSVAGGASSGTYAITAGNGQAADPNGNAVALATNSGSVTIGGGQQNVASWLLPSSAHSQGANGAYYTTDLAIANTGTANGMVTLKFLAKDADGRSGPEQTLALNAGTTTVIGDVLGTLFGLSTGSGAIQIAATVNTISASSQTSTPPPPSCGAGTFGQSVPVFAASQLVTPAAARSIVGVREDSAFRSNLVLSNAGQAGCNVDVALVLGNGTVAGTKRYPLQPLGMTQANRVIRAIGYAADLSGARLVLSTPDCTPGFAAFASVIDNFTNDPRTVLPQ